MLKDDLHQGKVLIHQKKQEKYKFIEIYRPVKREYVADYRRNCIAEASEMLELESCRRLILGVLGLTEFRPTRRSRSTDTLERSPQTNLISGEPTGDQKLKKVYLLRRADGSDLKVEFSEGQFSVQGQTSSN